MAGIITEPQYSWHSCQDIAGAITELNMASTITEPDNLKRERSFEKKDFH